MMVSIPLDRLSSSDSMSWCVSAGPWRYSINLSKDTDDQDFQAAISSLEKCRQPIIAALFGVSLGLAIDIASACDIRLAASNAIFGIMVSQSSVLWPPCAFHLPRCTRTSSKSWQGWMKEEAMLKWQEVDVGLAADIGTLQRLPKIIGNESKARELALTARKFGAEEAREMGCVSSVIKGGRKEVMGEASQTRQPGIEERC